MKYFFRFYLGYDEHTVCGRKQKFIFTKINHLVHFLQNARDCVGRTLADNLRGQYLRTIIRSES